MQRCCLVRISLARIFVFFMRLTELKYLGSIKSGKLHAPRDRMSKELFQIDDEDDVEIVIRREKRPKSWPQIKTFHGPIVNQVQAHYMDTEGLYKSPDRIKRELKEQFLSKEKQFYDDGSPVMIKVAHPERKGVFYDWHMEVIPSLADLSVEQMRGLIDTILAYFLHERGCNIVIEPREAS